MTTKFDTIKPLVSELKIATNENFCFVLKINFFRKYQVLVLLLSEQSG